LGGGSGKSSASASSSGGKDKSWDTEELQHLIKAVNLFPAGTNDRWVKYRVNKAHAGHAIR